MALDLNEHHHHNVVEYMRFARYQRGQRLKGVDLCFEELKDSRLIEDTFTIDEVSDMLDGLLSVVRGEVESELINTAHTNILLLRQLFQQSEKWHLKLQADISELENRELLEKIRDFESKEFSQVEKKSSSRLQPVNESAGSALLNMEIERLQQENDLLKDRCRHIESQAVASTQERNNLQRALDDANKLGGSRNTKAVPDHSEEVDQLRAQLASLRSSLDSANKGGASKMDGELTNTKHELLKIREMLDMAERELEKKVSQTAPFKNLKSMLQKKNDQLKDLRRRLSKYESLDD